MALEFFLQAKPAQKGNSKLIYRTGYRGSGATRVVSNPKDKAAEARLTAMARVHRPLRPLEGALRLDVQFVLTIPKSWSKRQRAEALAGVILPTTRPDRGNCLKLIEDCLQSAGFYLDDSQIVAGEVGKRYGDPAGYLVRLSPVEGPEADL